MYFNIMDERPWTNVDQIDKRLKNNFKKQMY